MNLVLAQTTGMEYVPNYLFVSGKGQRGPGKSRHVMKEFLRKRDSIRRQNQLAAKSHSRVLPWLRREDVEQERLQSSEQTEDTGASDGLSDSESVVSTPQPSQLSGGSSIAKNHASAPVLDNATSKDIPDEYQKHQDSLNRVVIAHLYETDRQNNLNAPMTVMTQHLTKEPPSAQIALAIASLSVDIEEGRQSPSSGTLGLVVEGIQVLKEQLRNPDGVSEHCILAVICLWAYEAKLGMGMPEGKTESVLSKSVTKNIQTHIKGLQKTICCLGGLRNLTSETLWLLAWCLCTLPGYSPIDTKMMEPSLHDDTEHPENIDSSSSLAWLYDTLATIQSHSSPPASHLNMLYEASFFPLRGILARFSSLQHSIGDQTAPVARLQKSTSLIALLLYLFDILLGVTEDAPQDPKDRREELARAQERLLDHGLDREGSFEKAWQVLMTQQETPRLQLHPRAWSIAELVNVCKQLHVNTIDSLSKLLLRYLLPDVNGPVEDLENEKMLLQMHFELDELADFS